MYMLLIKPETKKVEIELLLGIQQNSSSFKMFVQGFIVNLTTARLQWCAFVNTSVTDYNIN